MTTEHTYRGYSFSVNGNEATILTAKGLETLPIAHVLTFIDAAWDKFDRARGEVITGKSSNIVKEALVVAVNAWEYDGEHDKAKAAAEIINGSSADNADFINGASYVVDYVENELGIDLSETGLAEYRNLNA